MRQTWRWFGPEDKTTIEHVMQAGAEGIVSALHHIPNGEIWPVSEIKDRQQIVSYDKNGVATGICWEVVESLPVSEDIKKQKGEWRAHISNYKESLQNIAECGIKVVCYNFMPVLDWTRTDLAWRLPHGGTTMRFDHIDFAVFDLFILARDGAYEEYPDTIIDQAEIRYKEMSSARKNELIDNIACGLPGAVDVAGLDEIKEQLQEYKGIDDAKLRKHLYQFLEEVIPVAQKLGLRLCCHPDDPPFPLLGLPRIVSTESDYQQILDAVNLPANGITLCAGSLGVRSDNDLAGMMCRFGNHVHFIHLRNVCRETDGIPLSFHEQGHLKGDTDMVRLIMEILAQEKKRRQKGRTDWNIPVRPDHGVDILDDLQRKGQPGYPSIGRLQGLAEIRGVMQALSYKDNNLN